jgi:hypothetical protein
MTSYCDHTLYCPEVYNQGDLNSCAINAFCTIFCCKMNKYISDNPNMNITIFTPSRYCLYFYSNTINFSLYDGIIEDYEIKILDETKLNDTAGSNIYIIDNTISRFGLFRELDFESDINIMNYKKIYDDPCRRNSEQIRFLDNIKIEKTINHSKLNKIFNFINSYTKIIQNYNNLDIVLDNQAISEAKKWSKNISYNNLTEFVKYMCLISDANFYIMDILNKEPICIYINMYNYSGFLPYLITPTIKPSYCPDTTNDLHAMVIIGYHIDKYNKPLYLVRNSWGKRWGESGNCYLSSDFFKKISTVDDFKINSIHTINIDFDKYYKSNLPNQINPLLN